MFLLATLVLEMKLKIIISPSEVTIEIYFRLRSETEN